jgi:hypothetical protein
MNKHKSYICGACGSAKKTRRCFYVCDKCAAITCKKCVGRGCDPSSHSREEVKSFTPLMGAFKQLKDIGYIMSDWE